MAHLRFQKIMKVGEIVNGSLDRLRQPRETYIRFRQVFEIYGFVVGGNAYTALRISTSHYVIAQGSLEEFLMTNKKALSEDN